MGNYSARPQREHETADTWLLIDSYPAAGCARRSGISIDRSWVADVKNGLTSGAESRGGLQLIGTYLR